MTPCSILTSLSIFLFEKVFAGFKLNRDGALLKFSTVDLQTPFLVLMDS